MQDPSILIDRKVRKFFLEGWFCEVVSSWGEGTFIHTHLYGTVLVYCVGCCMYVHFHITLSDYIQVLVIW